MIDRFFNYQNRWQLIVDSRKKYLSRPDLREKRNCFIYLLHIRWVLNKFRWRTHQEGRRTRSSCLSMSNERWVRGFFVFLVCRGPTEACFTFMCIFLRNIICAFGKIKFFILCAVPIFLLVWMQNVLLFCLFFQVSFIRIFLHQSNVFWNSKSFLCLSDACSRRVPSELFCPSFSPLWWSRCGLNQTLPRSLLDHSFRPKQNFQTSNDSQRITPGQNRSDHVNIE